MSMLQKLNPALFFFASTLAIVIAFGVYDTLETNSKRMIPLMTAVCVILVIQYTTYSILRARKGVRYASLWAFTIALSLWGLLFLLLFPPMSVPDEPYHYYAAYQLSDVLMFLGQGSKDAFPMRAEDVEFVSNGAIASSVFGSECYREIAHALMDANVDSAMVESSYHALPDSVASNPLQDRLAPALGISLGRLLGLNGVLTFYCGRIASLALFVAMLHFAFKFTPTGKPVIATVALIPMTLHLAGSYSYDSFTIGASFLLISLLLNALCAKEITRKNVAAIAIVAAVLAPCKVVYFMPVLLILFSRRSQFSSKSECRAAKAIVIGAALLSLIAFKAVDFFTMLSDTTTQELDRRGDETGQFYSIKDIIAQPVSMLEIYTRTVFSTLDHICRTMIGGALGWFQGNIQAPLYIIVLLYTVLFASLIPSKDDKQKLSVPIRVTAVAISALCWAAVMTSMLVGWTFNTENVINGLQGRYFIPMLPLLLIALRPRRMGSAYNMAFWGPFCMCVIDAIYVLYISASLVGL